MGFSAEVVAIAPGNLRRIKSDRRFLELALEEAGDLMTGRPTRISDNACCCPFHHDEHPSGSLHQDNRGNGPGGWLFTCHACGDFGGGGGWNDLNPRKPGSSGDAAAVLLVAAKRAGREMSFQRACQWLLDTFDQRYGQQAFTVPAARPPPVADSPHPQLLARAEEEAAEACRKLMDEPELLQRLWVERAVNQETLRRFGVGHLLDRFGRDWCVFPIRHADGRFMVQKRHALDGAQPKCLWDPRNAKTGKPLYPVALTAADPIWLCPGEFKALAVISLGLAAVGWACGEEDKQLPLEAIEVLRGRTAAIPPDNDETGRNWAEAVQNQLVAAGIDARVVNLGFTMDGEDLGDWIVERRVKRGLDAPTVGSELLNAFEQASRAVQATAATPDNPVTAGDGGCVIQTQPAALIRSVGDLWSDPETWRPVKRVPTHIKKLDEALYGGFPTRGVHLLVGKPGAAKTQLAVQIAVNAATQGVRVGLVTLEMDRAEVARLALAQISSVPRRSIDRGLKLLHDRQAAHQVKQAMRTCRAMPLDIIDGDDMEGGFTREHLRAVVAEGVQNRAWRLVLLDHLGELAPMQLDPLGQTLQVDKANASVLRGIAKRFDVALVVVAPLRKTANFKDAQKGKFTVDDVMGSAAVGYSVQTCIAVTSMYQDPPGQSQLKLHFLKNRKAPTPDKPLELRWEPACGRILDPR